MGRSTPSKPKGSPSSSTSSTPPSAASSAKKARKLQGLSPAAGFSLSPAAKRVSRRIAEAGLQKPAHMTQRQFAYVCIGHGRGMTDLTREVFADEDPAEREAYVTGYGHIKTNDMMAATL
jgi:hypothetical protein